MSPRRDLQYPVIVTYTLTHVVWVDGESSEDAARSVEDCPSEWTDDKNTLALVEATVDAPSPCDWYWIQCDGVTYPGTNADAHVQHHRAVELARRLDAERGACAAKGHPDTEPCGHRQWCKTCGYVDAAPAGAVAA